MLPYFDGIQLRFPFDDSVPLRDRFNIIRQIDFLDRLFCLAGSHVPGPEDPAETVRSDSDEMSKRQAAKELASSRRMVRRAVDERAELYGL